MCLYTVIVGVYLVGLWSRILFVHKKPLLALKRVYVLFITVTKRENFSRNKRLASPTYRAFLRCAHHALIIIDKPLLSMVGR